MVARKPYGFIGDTPISMVLGDLFKAGKEKAGAETLCRAQGDQAREIKFNRIHSNPEFSPQRAQRTQSTERKRF